MLFSTGKNTLLASLEVACKAVAVKTSMPILEGILIDVKDGKVTLTGSNESMTIVSSFSTMDCENGSVVVADAKLLLEYVKQLGDGNITLKNDENNLKVTSGKSKSQIAVVSSEKYPKFKSDKETNVLNVVQSELKTALKETIYAIAQEETRPILTGIHFDIKDGHLTFVAIDGYRMSIKSITVDSENSFSFTVPGKELKEVLKLLKNNENSIKIIVTKNSITFELENEQKIIIRLLEGEFIKYEQILPADSSIRVKVKKEELNNSIVRTSLIASKNNSGSRLIKLDLNPDKIVVSANTTAGSSVDELSVIEYSGDPLKIAFNSTYWTDMLNSIEDEDDIIMSFTSSVAPVIVRKAEDDGFIGLILPVRILDK